MLVVEEVVNKAVKRGRVIVHGREDIEHFEEDPFDKSKKEKWRLRANRAIFLLNTNQVGNRAFWGCEHLVVVDIPEGVEAIKWCAFLSCHSLSSISFPKSLKSIGFQVFFFCLSLEYVDLLHTNLRELGESAFQDCQHLTSIRLPDSLRKSGFGKNTFAECRELVPDEGFGSVDTYKTDEVVTYLRAQQQLLGDGKEWPRIDEDLKERCVWCGKRSGRTICHDFFAGEEEHLCRECCGMICDCE